MLWTFARSGGGNLKTFKSSLRIFSEFDFPENLSECWDGSKVTFDTFFEEIVRPVFAPLPVLCFFLGPSSGRIFGPIA